MIIYNSIRRTPSPAVAC